MNTTTLASAAVPHPADADTAEDTVAQERHVTEHGPEIAVAAFLALLGGVVVFDSVRLGAGWADDGPQSGYFPFYIGLMLLASSGVVLIKALAAWMASRSATAASPAPVFVEHEQLKLVMAMLVPATLYVAVMGFVGLYLSSIVLIAWFMRRHGRFGWPLSAAVSVGVPLTVFVVFERWFLVPLPKGPIEAMLGF